jgi:FlaA1/EpsC-like NDP-sugar epimerase
MVATCTTFREMRDLASLQERGPRDGSKRPERQKAPWHEANVLITGAAGFLGSHLCDRFIKEGYHVIGMDNLITGRLKNIEHLFKLEVSSSTPRREQVRVCAGRAEVHPALRQPRIARSTT